MVVFVAICFTTLANGNNAHVDRGIYYPKSSKNLDEAKATISRVLNDKCVTVYDAANAQIK
jgi:hypothetical protein